MDEQNNNFYNSVLGFKGLSDYKINCPCSLSNYKHDPCISVGASVGATVTLPPPPPPTPEELEKRRIESEKWEKEQMIEKHKRLEWLSTLKGLYLGYHIYFEQLGELKCFHCEKLLGYGETETEYGDSFIQFCSKECFDKACEKDEKRRIDEFEEFKKTMEA